MDFSYWLNLLLTFFNLINEQQENNVPETRPLPFGKSVHPEEFDAMIEKALSPLRTRLKNSEDQILELKNKAVTERDALETKLKNSEDQILELKDKVNTEAVQVVFSAAVGLGNYHYGPYNTDKPLIFKKVITNIGNAYKKAKGIFVAPFAGIYYFVFFHHAGGKSGTSLYLVKEEERIVQAQNHPLVWERAHNGGNAAFLQLKAGDHVFISMGPETQVWASETHTTFSGFLVKRTEDEKTESLSK